MAKPARRPCHGAGGPGPRALGLSERRRQDQSIVLADDAHRSHADRSFSEELHCSAARYPKASKRPTLPYYYYHPDPAYPPPFLQLHPPRLCAGADPDQLGSALAALAMPLLGRAVAAPCWGCGWGGADADGVGVRSVRPSTST